MSVNNIIGLGNGPLVSATANYLQILNTFYNKENLRKNDLDISLDKQTLKLIEATNNQTQELLNEIIANFEFNKEQNIEIIKQNEELINLEKEILFYLREEKWV